MYYSVLLLHQQQPPAQTHKTMLQNFQLYKRKNNAVCCNTSAPKNYRSIEFDHNSSVRRCKEVLGSMHTEEIKQHNSSNFDRVNFDPSARKNPQVQLVNKTKRLLKIKKGHNNVLENIPNRVKPISQRKISHQKNINSLSLWSKNHLALEQKNNGLGSLLSFEHQSPIHYAKRTQTPQNYRRKDTSAFQQRKSTQILNPQLNSEFKNEQNVFLNISIKQQKQNIKKYKQKEDWIDEFFHEKLKKSQQKIEKRDIYHKLHLRHRQNNLRGQFINEELISSNKAEPKKKVNQNNKQSQRHQIQPEKPIPMQRSVSKQQRKSYHSNYGRPNTTAQKKRYHPQQIEEKLQPW